MENKEKLEIVQKLAKTNSYNYNLLKAVEELTELSEVLMKRVLKGSEHGASDQEIIDEIGDVNIRIYILAELFGKENIYKRVDEKINKYKQYIDEGKYTGSI